MTTVERPVLTPSRAAVLPVGWAWHRLDQLCDGVFDCPHSTPKLAASGPLMARSQDIRTGAFRVEQAARVSEATYRERVKRAEPRAGDLLYSREGTYFGIAAEVPSGERVCLGQRMVLLRPNARRLNYRFLKYWLNSPVLQAHVHGQRDGSVAERLNLPTIRALPVPTPALDEQRAIAHVLGVLDDKIELNRQMNETLEAMARALFRSWFVDFDPVRAKMEGRAPVGMDAETAALFPDRLEDSALGCIPRGWRVLPAGEAVRAVGGGTPSTKEPSFWGGVHHWARPKDLSGLRSPVLLTTEQRLTDEGLAKVSSGLLPAGVVLLSSRAPIGYLAIAEVPVAVNQGFIAMVCDGPVSNLYVLRWCQENMAEIEARASGTTFPEISKKSFRPISMLVPARDEHAAFTRLAAPLHERVVANLRESATLAELRDLLLPKLLSGELRVKDAEKQLEAVA